MMFYLTQDFFVINNTIGIELLLIVFYCVYHMTFCLLVMFLHVCYIMIRNFFLKVNIYNTQFLLFFLSIYSYNPQAAYTIWSLLPFLPSDCMSVC